MDPVRRILRGSERFPLLIVDVSKRESFRVAGGTPIARGLREGITGEANALRLAHRDGSNGLRIVMIPAIVR